MAYWCNYIVNEYVPSTATRQWQIPLAMQMVPSSLLVFAALFILPESPRFLVKKGHKIQARKVLGYVRNLEIGHEYINAEIEEIEDAIRRQEIASPRSKPGFLGLMRELCWKGNRRRIVIGMGLMFGQNLTGIGGVNFYTPTIFKSIGFDGTELVLLASGLLFFLSSP
jgi:MFS family permease